MRHLGSLRMYESVLRALSAGGHEIRILANRRDTIGSGVDPETLLGDLPRISWSWEEFHPHRWSELAAAVRIWLDYLRFFEPRYADAPRLRTRVGEYVPSVLLRVNRVVASPIRHRTPRTRCRAAGGRAGAAAAAGTRRPDAR